MNLRSENQTSKVIWVVAGEVSGDARAAEVVKAIREQQPHWGFMGAGGPNMEPLADAPFDNWIEEAGVVGLWDVLKNYGYFRRKFASMLDAIQQHQPDAVLLVDYPGFNLRLAKALRARFPELKILYYVSPQVWAWNRGRISKMARWLDAMICIFPFEVPLYAASGLKAYFVGHPLVGQLTNGVPCLERESNLLGLFPGSREREVRRIFPVLLEAAKLVLSKLPDVRIEAAAASIVHAEQMERAVRAAKLPVQVSVGKARELMQRATVGLVCSGTATLEAAIYEMPYGLVYKTAWLTYEVGKRLVKVSHLGIVNILANRTVVREFIQKDATGPKLAEEALRLLEAKEDRQQLIRELQEVVQTLDGENAIQRAAHVIIDKVA